MSESPKKKKKLSLKPSPFLVTIAAIVLLVLCFGIPTWGEPSTKREESGDSTKNAASDSHITAPRNTSEPNVRVPLKAPAHTKDWSREVNVPSGYRPFFCEADESLACTDTETDMTQVRFDFDCRDLRGNASIRTEEADLIACRVRAKDNEALNLAVWLEPY